MAQQPDSDPRHYVVPPEVQACACSSLVIADHTGRSGDDRIETFARYGRGGGHVSDPFGAPSSVARDAAGLTLAG